MGSSCLVSRLQFPSMTQTAAYFPLMLLAIDRSIERPCLRSMLILAGIIALTVLAGHPQMAYLILMSTLLYAIIRVLHHFRNIRRQRLTIRRRNIVATLSAGLALGLALTAAQIIPCVQLLVESPRRQMTAAQANRFVFEPSHLLTLIFPRFFGHPASADYWGGGNAWEPSLFMGWLPLILAGAAIKWSWKRRRIRFWTILGLFALWTSFGNSGGLYWIAFKIIPGVSSFHDPARFLFLTTFAIVVLSAVGLDRYLENSSRDTPILRWGVILVTVIPLWWNGLDWNPTYSPPVKESAPKIVEVIKKSIESHSRIYLPAHDLLGQRFISDGYSNYGIEDIQNQNGFISTLIPNLNMRWNIESASGYEPVPIYAPSVLDGLARTAMRRNEPNFSRLVGMMHAGLVLVPSSDHLFDPRMSELDTSNEYGKRFYGQIRAAVNLDTAPIAWTVHHSRHLEGKLRIPSALSAPDFLPQGTVILSGNIDPRSQYLEWMPEPTASEAYIPAVVHQHSATDYSILADCGYRPGILVFSVTAYPGWHAAVNGSDAIISRANGAYMAVYLPPGRSMINIQYSPGIYAVGLYVTCIASLLFSFIGVRVCLNSD